jgi:hypothetical protein
MTRRLAAALLASSCLVPLSCTPAKGEPISTAIFLTAGIEAIVGSGIAIGGTVITAGAIGGAIVSAGISVGISVLSSMLTAKPAEGTAGSASGTDLGVQYGATVARSARMGPGATGGHHVYTNVADSGPNGTNDILQCVFVIGDGQHGKLTRLRYNGKDCTVPPDFGPYMPTGYVVPEFLKAGAPKVIIRYFNGRYDQTADAQLIFYSNPPGRWTTDHRGRGVAYLSIDQVYDEELSLTGIPTVQIETEGLVLYDPRFDSTNGGSGPQRWGLPDTYVPSANPAIQEYNFRRGIQINGQRVLGMNVSPVNLLLEMYFAAANTNDEAVPLAAGGTEPRYRCSVECSDDRANSDVLAALRAATAGWSLERGGQFGPIPGVPQIPIASLAFTDDDMIVGERASFTKYRSRTEIVTAIHGQFSDPAQFWTPVAFPARENAADDAAMGEKIARDMDLTQVYSSSQAQRIAESERRRTLQNGQGTATLPAKWIGVQPGDWLPFNSVRHGNMTVLVTGVALDTARHLVTLTFERTSNTVYSWTTAGELFPPDFGTFAQSGLIAMSAQGMSAIGINVQGDGGLVTPGIAFAWTPIMDPSVDQIDFEIRKAGETTPVLPFTADFPSSGSAVCSGHGIAAATNYEYRHKLYTTPYRDTPWSIWLTVMSGTQQVVQNALTSIPGDVTLASFEAGLKQYVGEYLAAAQEEVDRIQQLIASVATEQDAHNYLEKLQSKDAAVQLREQVSAQYGTTWRGEWNVNTHYDPLDQVTYGGEMYFTSTAVQGVAPPAAPWVKLFTSARISQEWRTFAGDDGAAAQTSDSIEVRFGSDTLALSVATLTSRWQAYAGADLAVAKSETEVLAAIGDNSASITTNATAIATVDGKVAGTWQVKLDVNHYVTGLQAYNDGSTSNFTIIADQFNVAYPAASMPPTVVFAIGSRTNAAGTTVTKLVLHGDMILDGAVTAGSIATGSLKAIHVGTNLLIANDANIDALRVKTLHIADASVTVSIPWSGSSTVFCLPGSAFTTVANVTQSVTSTPGSIISVDYKGWSDIHASSASAFNWMVRVNGTQVDGGQVVGDPSGGTTTRIHFSGPLNIAATGAAQNINLDFIIWSGNNNDYAQTRQGVGIAFKK